MNNAITPATLDDTVVFTSPPPLSRPGFEPHAGGGQELVEVVEKKVRDLREDYRHVVSQIASMVEDSAGALGDGLALTEITVALGFDITGKLGFVLGGVEAKSSTTVTLKLEYKQP